MTTIIDTVRLLQVDDGIELHLPQGMTGESLVTWAQMNKDKIDDFKARVKASL